jgi:hypothetical protein
MGWTIRRVIVVFIANGFPWVHGRRENASAINKMEKKVG